MKQKLHRSLLTIVALLICLLFGIVLTIYAKPMEAVSLDLSLSSNTEIFLPDSQSFDSKGWTVYLCDQGTVTELTADGFGGYTGIKPGQTFYFSRVMEEELDYPTLQLGTVNRQFSVWLDDMLIYTDCPELDNRIGYLSLPMNDWDRTDPITISLPRDYRGKTLTIAQSFPTYTEGGSVKAFPCSVMLYCSYAYESALIAESFQTAFITIIAFLAGVLLLLAFLRGHNAGTLALALVAFLWMTGKLISVSFYYSYFGTQFSSLSTLCRPLLTIALLVFLTTRAGRYRKLLWGMNIAYSISLVIYALIPVLCPDRKPQGFLEKYLMGRIQEWIILLTLLLLLSLAVLYWRKESRFYRYFSITAPAALLISWGVRIIQNPHHVLFQILIQLQEGQVAFLTRNSLEPVMFVTLLLALAEILRHEADHRMEKHLLSERQEMTLAGYENIRRQHEEIMILRHDMLKHFHTLRELSGEEKITAYLDELLGQNQGIRSVVQTGNEMLDIILNSKLSEAADKGIRIDVIRSSAPEQLPLTDADLCSLFLNIMDNAIAAASSSGVAVPFLRLDLHVKNEYLAFVCENTVNPNQPPKHEIKEPTPKHGLGLKIIRNITERYHGLIDIEYRQNTFQIRVGIPIH